MAAGPTPAGQLELPVVADAAVPLRAIDLFCGAGGLSEGLRQAGLQMIAGTDNDPDACATFAHNFPGVATLCGDIRDLAMREQIHEVATGVDVVVGGPPCQAFSQVRSHTRLIDDPRNSLYREFVRTVVAAGPAAFLMENVPGMAQMGVQEQVLADLALDGEYEVEAQLCNAADFGVPQTRKRLLFLGVRRDLGAVLPTLTGTGVTSLLQLARFGGRRPTYGLATRPEADAARLAVQLADPEDLAAVTAEQALSDLDGLLATGRRADTLKGDSAYHYGPPRCLSVREFARLQSFPDRFVFTTDPRKGPLPGRIDGGAAHSRYRQVGNAVPPLLAASAASALQQAVLAARVRRPSRLIGLRQWLARLASTT